MIVQETDNKPCEQDSFILCSSSNGLAGFEKGKLYKNKYCLFIYLTSILAAKCSSTEGNAPHSRCEYADNPPDNFAKNFRLAKSLEHSCTVRISDPNDVLMFLGSQLLISLRNGCYIRTLNLLFPTFSGWVVYVDNRKFERVE